MSKRINDEMNNTESQKQTEYVSERERCIDRGPAWIKAICAFIILSSHYGILNCGALFYPGLEEALQIPLNVLCWLMTGQFAITFCLAPLYNRLLDLVANRPATIISVAVTSAAIIASVFFNSYLGFFLTYTLVGGIGMGISFVRVIAVMAEYFDNYRILALAICSSGAGFGTVIYSQLGNYMIDNYTWRIALISFALLHLNVIPLSLLNRPLSSEPTPEPTILMPNDPIMSTMSLKSVPGIPNMYASQISTMGGGIGGSILTNMDETGQRCKSETMFTRLTGQDIIGVVEFIKISCDKSNTNELTVSPINFINDLEPQILERIQTAADEYFDNLENNTPETLLNNVDETQLNMFLPIIFLVCDRLTGIQSNLPSEKQFLLGSRLSGIEKLFTDRSSQLGSTAFMNTYTSVEQIPNLNKATTPKTVQKPSSFIGDSITSSVLKAYDAKQTANMIRAIIQRASNKVTEISKELISNKILVHPKPLIVIINQKSIDTVNSKLPSEDRLCVLGYTKPGDDTIFEESENEYQNDNESNDDDDNDSGNNIDNENISPKSEQTVKETVKTSGRNRLISPGYHLTNSYLNLRSPKISCGSRGYIDQMIRSGTTVYQSQAIIAPFYKYRDMPVKTSCLSMTSVMEPKEAVEYLTSKIDNEQDQEYSSDEERKKAKQSIVNSKNILFLSFLITRTLTYIGDSILFAHFINFGISSGLKEEQATGLLAYVGLASMLGRLGIGLVGQFSEKLEIRSIVAVTLFILSIHTIFMPFYPTYPALAGYGICYSLFVGPSFAFSNSMTIQIMGDAKMDRSLSLVLFFEATGYLIGGPLGGIIKEQTGNYSSTFLFSGLCNIIASIIVTVHALIKFNSFERIKQYLFPRVNQKIDNLNELSV
ncbi:unnamed protein product [Trichobilharzia szidati]|nr:unnamed protein product [Trichobilharzia szidati]